MPLFRVHHLFHFIRRRPHTFAYLRFSGQAATNTNINIPIFVGVDLGLTPDRLFSGHRSGEHAGVNFVAGAIEKTGVNKDQSL